jgi:hypothetical protein
MIDSCLYFSQEQNLNATLLPEGYAEIGFNMVDMQISTIVNGRNFRLLK